MGRRGAAAAAREEFDLDVTARMIGELYEELYAAAGAEALRVLFYADYSYHADSGRVSAETSFALFVARLSGAPGATGPDRQESTRRPT